MSYRFFTVDAFSNIAFQGAPILVFPDADPLSETLMQQIATEFNFAETVFCVNPSSVKFVKRLRIFTPAGEIPFAGHPTIGAAFVLAHTGIIHLDGITGECLLEEGAQALKITVTKPADTALFVEFAVPLTPKADTYVPSVRELVKILHLEPSDFDTNKFNPLVVFGDKPYLIIPLIDSQALQNARFSHSEWLKSSATTTIEPNIFLFSPADKASNDHFHARLLGPHIGLHDDPPIGSAVPALAGYLCSFPAWNNQDRKFTVQRGVGHKRLSTLKVTVENNLGEDLIIRVGGSSVLVSEGTLLL